MYDKRLLVECKLNAVLHGDMMKRETLLWDKCRIRQVYF